MIWLMCVNLWKYDKWQHCTGWIQLRNHEATAPMYSTVLPVYMRKENVFHPFPVGYFFCTGPTSMEGCGMYTVSWNSYNHNWYIYYCNNIILLWSWLKLTKVAALGSSIGWCMILNHWPFIIETTQYFTSPSVKECFVLLNI